MIGQIQITRCDVHRRSDTLNALANSEFVRIFTSCDFELSFRVPERIARMVPANVATLEELFIHILPHLDPDAVHQILAAAAAARLNPK